MSNPPTTSVPEDELFDLCKEVYRRTNWDDDSLWHKTYEDYRPDLDISVPLYTSDYLLEKLPEHISKYGSMTMERGYMSGRTGAFRYKYSRDNREELTEGTGVTSLKALLKLVLALDKAGIKL